MIALEHLNKEFSTRAGTVIACRDVSITVNTGEIFGIIGFSGAGKSTLARLINMLEKPDSGHIYLDGVDMTALSGSALLAARRKIGMVFQRFNLFMQRTALQNVMFPLSIAHEKKADAKKRAMDMLDVVGLADKADSYPSTLSGGQMQRVAIARALVTNPSVLLCDEATSALDPSTTRSVLSLLETINKEFALTIVVITHQMEVIRQIAGRVAIMENGSVVEEGETNRIFFNPRSAAAKKLIGEVSDPPVSLRLSARHQELEKLLGELMLAVPFPLYAEKCSPETKIGEKTEILLHVTENSQYAVAAFLKEKEIPFTEEKTTDALD